MSYHRKVIYISLGVLLGVTLLTFLAELVDGGNVDGLEVGIVALSFSLFEAVLLLLAAAGIALFGRDRMVQVRPAKSQDLLDDKGSYQRKLTKGQQAGACCAAAGLVLLLGGSLCFGSLGLGSSGFDVR